MGGAGERQVLRSAGARPVHLPRLPDPHSVADVVLDVLAHAPRIGVYVLDRDLRVTSATPSAAEMLFRSEPSEVIGRPLSRLMSIDYASGFPERVCADGTHLERLIWGGWQVLSLCRVMRERDEMSCVVVVHRVVGMLPEVWNGLTVVSSPVADFGPLDVLSDREIEIASLIGLGLTVKDIASHVQRSSKTVENHRIAIGRKLGLSDRLQIGLMAYNAGLRPEDANLKRVHRQG